MNINLIVETNSKVHLLICSIVQEVHSSSIGIKIMIYWHTQIEVKYLIKAAGKQQIKIWQYANFEAVY